MTEAGRDSVIRGNIKGQFVPSKFAGIAMRQQRYGRVVSFVSDAGLGAVGASNYAAAGEGRWASRARSPATWGATV